nr:tyrosine-type recombinase/integrase [Micromonospora olivasterospora]
MAQQGWQGAFLRRGGLLRWYTSPSGFAVALDKRTVQILREHDGATRSTIPPRGGRKTLGRLRLRVRPQARQPHPPRLCQRPVPAAGQTGRFPPVRLHELRHDAASLAHEAGADLKTLRDMLGHSSIGLPPTPTPASYPWPSGAAQTPPPTWSSPPPTAPAARSGRKPPQPTRGSRSRTHKRPQVRRRLPLCPGFRLMGGRAGLMRAIPPRPRRAGPLAMLPATAWWPSMMCGMCALQQVPTRVN